MQRRYTENKSMTKLRYDENMTRATTMNDPDMDELLRFAVEASGLAPWEWDLASRRVYLSPQWAGLVGQELAGVTRSMDDLLAHIHPEDVERVKIRMEEVLLGFKTRYVAEFRVRSGGGWLWTEGLGLVTHRDGEGRALRMVGANSDISIRRRAQEAMATARQSAEDSDRAKSELLANVSHELRTPLNAIIGLTKLLQQSKVDDEQRNFLHLIDNSAVTLLTLLNDVLDFSKIEAGKLLFENVRFDLRKWADEAVAPHAMEGERKGLQVQLHVSPDLPRTLVGDPGRLRQIVSNLLANAVKFTARGGIAVTLQASPEQDDMHGERMRVLIEVRDTGIGIPAEKQAAIFDAFTQVDASTTRQYGGTGLGLAICARLAALMEGQISVSSELGEGSAFQVSVVLSRVDDNSGPHTVPMTEEERSLVGLSVLLAEDNAVNELLMRRTLTQMGCSVAVAHDGEEALAMWSAQPFDLILMDVQMPRLSGFDATGRIREAERETGNHMPIVALTAHAMIGDRDKCIAAGMDSYVSKPVAPEMLTRAMREALKRAPEMTTLMPEVFLSDWDGNEQDGLDFPEITGALDDGPPEAGGASAAALSPLLSKPKDRMVRRLKAAIAAREADGVLVALLDLKALLATHQMPGAITLAGSLEYAARQARWSLLERALPIFEQHIERIHE